MSRHCYAILSVMIACLLMSGHTYGHAQSIRSTEQVVKATFLYNFAKFVEWPDGTFTTPDSPIILCILGDNPFGRALAAIENKNIKGRRLGIRLCRDVSETTGCHILYISPSEQKQVPHILNSIKHQSFLTVSDTEMFGKKGGMIYLFKTEHSVQFEINLEVARKARLKISSRLLKLARIIDSD